jgi:valyl-tRNA synthetase
MDLRPQAHDIIRTWLFATIVRSHLEFDALPWSDAAISGWILDPDRKKMSKSRGNVVTPMSLLEQYGADGVRYWSAGARPGTDTAFDEGQMRIGRRLAIKILNVSRFVLAADRAPVEAGSDGQARPALADVRSAVEGVSVSGGVVEPLDASILASLRQLVEEATSAFEGYDYARALERTEAFFWSFCDDYVELVKNRAYGTLGEVRASSARSALRVSLSVLLRLFAPFLPYVTEEVWSWWHDHGSIHREPWPSLAELGVLDGTPDVLAAASELLGEVRRTKTAAGASLKTEVRLLRVNAGPQRLALLRAAADDLREAAGLAGAFEMAETASELDETVDVELS